MKYKVSTYAKIHGVTMRTVWNWINKGELEIERTSTGRIECKAKEDNGIYAGIDIGLNNLATIGFNNGN